MNPISAVILKMSESAAWERRISNWRVTRRVVERFMPGERLDDAVTAAHRINADGMAVSLNPVGEHVHSREEAEAATGAYLQILQRIREEQLDGNMSLKLSLLGLDLGADVAAANLSRILATAATLGIFVRIDMESSAYVDPTLEIYRDMRREFDDVGLVIQSYLRRSARDVDELVGMGAAVRLVKGAYKEPPDIAFADKADVDRNFERLMTRMLDEEAQASGVRLAVATHDRALVEKALARAAQRGIDRGLEFQMLYGIARGLQRNAGKGAYPVRIYISYGEAWYPWFMRRLAERPANLGFFLKHLVS